MGNRAFYHSKAWRIKRGQILRRDKNLCRESQRYGKRVDATTVHHIYPLEQYPEWALADWNLISLCAEQHEAMHDRKLGTVTDVGLQWQRRRSEGYKNCEGAPAVAAENERRIFCKEGVISWCLL